MTDNGWSEWQNHVLAELGRLNTCVEKIERDKGCIHEGIKTQITSTKEDLKADIAKISAEIAVLKVKAGIWGAVAGVIPGSVVLVWVLVRYFTG